MESRLLSIQEAASLLRLKVPTLRAWIRAGKISYVKLNGSIRFEPDALDTLIETNRVEATPAQQS